MLAAKRELFVYAVHCLPFSRMAKWTGMVGENVGNWRNKDDETFPSHKEAKKNNQNVSRQLSCHKINIAKPYLSPLPVPFAHPIRMTSDRWISTQNNKMHN